MKTLAIAVMCACMALATSAGAQDPAKKTDAMTKDAMKPMTMQDCKDYMAMAKDATKKDEKKDTMCADMMKKEGAMKKDAMPAEPAKK